MESFAVFAKNKLGEHIADIEKALEKYLSTEFAKEAYAYHDSSAKAAEVFIDIVTRPAKRLRGSFVLEAFRMFSEGNTTIVMPAAIAIEIVHAYLLVIDDFNDRSDLRRGKPTAHRLHQRFHTERKMFGDSLHFGNSIATVSALFALHHAINIVLGMDFSPETKVLAAKGVNDAINITAYGQIRDIFNQQTTATTEHDVLEVHRLKTAHYTYFNPIQLGATLAGQTDATIAKFVGYTEPAGIAFQIQDDILGVFGKPEDTGKSNMDDIKEGKATLLTTYAYSRATPAQKEILDQTLGNRQLEATPGLFEKAQEVIVETGSLEHSKQVAHDLVLKAKESMYKEFPEYLDNDGFKFIVGIADYMIERKL